MRLSSGLAIIESPVIKVVHFLLCLSYSISDGFDSHALCVASLVLVCANPGCDKTISLVSSVVMSCFFLFGVAFRQCFLFKLIFFFVLEMTLFFSLLSLLIVVSSMQKSLTSSFLCAFASLLFSVDGKVRVGFSGVLSDVLFLWLLLVIINNRSKTDFSLNLSLVAEFYSV